jgi:hypothetical protein
MMVKYGFIKLLNYVDRAIAALRKHRVKKPAVFEC